MRSRDGDGTPGLRWQLPGWVAAAALFLGGIPAGWAQVEAQGWSADLNAARASFGAPPLGAGSTNAAVGVRYADGPRMFYTSMAAPLASGDLFWGVMGAGDRWAARRGRFEAGVDLSGLAHLQRDPSTEVGGSGGRMRGGCLRIRLGSNPGNRGEKRGLRVPGAGRREESWSRDLHLSDLSLALPLSSGGRERARLSGELRHLRPGGDEGAYTWAGGSVSGGMGQAGLWFSLGRWVHGLDGQPASTGFGGGASVATDAPDRAVGPGAARTLRSALPRKQPDQLGGGGERPAGNPWSSTPPAWAPRSASENGSRSGFHSRRRGASGRGRGLLGVGAAPHAPEGVRAGR
jgi:hypothetical protein